MADLDFPPLPTLGQKYTAPTGVVYEFDGYGWVVGFYDRSSQQLTSVGDILDQIRILSAGHRQHRLIGLPLFRRQHRALSQSGSWWISTV